MFVKCKEESLVKKSRQLQNDYMFEEGRTSCIRIAGSFYNGKMSFGDQQNVSFTFCYVN